ncbi:MAG: peptide deformylase [Polyangiales bacterium]
MAILPILQYPDKRLRIPGVPVTDFGPEFQAVIESMAETMYAAPGVGLAAPQVGISKRLFIVDISDSETEPSDLRVFANPEILEKRGSVIFDEGCLSFPGIREELESAAEVRVRAHDREGNVFELEANGLLAIAIQHETDHVDGKLMIDRMGPLRRRIVHRMLSKKQYATAK